MHNGGKKIQILNNVLIIEILQDIAGADQQAQYIASADQLAQSEKSFEEVIQAIAKKNAKISELIHFEEK